MVWVRSKKTLHHAYPFRHIWIYAIYGIWALLSIFAIYTIVTMIWPSGSSESHVATEKHIEYMRPLVSDDKYRWRSSSKYTLVIYESLDCKYCRKLNAEIYKNISYLRWKFNLVYRNAPLVDLEPLAAEKSLIAECVYRDAWGDKMFDFIDRVYVDYQIFHRDNIWVKNIAKKIMSTPQSLENCMSDPVQKSKIANDIKSLAIDGISSTPSIGIFYWDKLVGRYASGFNGTMRVIRYLATFEDNADQFWSDELFEKIQKWKI